MQANTPFRPFPSDELNRFLLHFTEMIGPYGLYQHATKREPLLREGYCTDDNARAVQVLVYLKKLISEHDQIVVEELLEKCWKFLQEAEEASGVYFNFRSSTGEWLDKDRSDDMYSRLIRALLIVIDHDNNESRIQEAHDKLGRLLQRVELLNAPRAWAEILVALGNASAVVRKKYNAQYVMEDGLQRLQRLWHDNASIEWPWFEPTMTYANAIFPHGILSSMPHMADPNLKTTLQASTDFLIKSTFEKDMFVPIGSEGWYPKGGIASHNNQQAIEAGMTFDFLLGFQSADQIPLEIIAAPYLWFFGRNSKKIMMVNENIGACLDGIFDTGPNPNYGAESMLAYLWAEVLLRSAPVALQNYIASLKI